MVRFGILHATFGWCRTLGENYINIHSQIASHILNADGENKHNIHKYALRLIIAVCMFVLAINCYYQTVRSYRLSWDCGECFMCCPQFCLKNHPTDILRGKNHFYGIVLVHVMRKTALNTTKHLHVAGYKILIFHINTFL